jgi:hypothetical protein
VGALHDDRKIESRKIPAPSRSKPILLGRGIRLIEAARPFRALSFLEPLFFYRTPMKTRFTSPLIAVLVLALPLSALAFDNQDVLKMQKAGLSEDTILAAMQKEKAEFDTGTDALIELKKAGVSEKIIQKMIALQSGGPAASSAPSSSESFSSAVNPVFLQDFPSIAPAKIDPVVGKDYFTRFTFHQEKNEYVTTNYSRGELIPINTPVKLVSMSGTKMVLKRLDNNQEIKVDNEEKYTKQPIKGIAAMMLSADRTPLEKLPDEVANAVKNGDLRRGMTKELALMARGYPPAHETPSTDGDRWTYWSSRFVKLTVLFFNGRLSEGRGIN